MTREEMDQFLISIGGLESGYFTNKEPITNSAIFGVGTGWFPIIKDLIEDLIKLGWNKQLCQVKEKFGGLRFYINDGNNEIFKRITEAEKQSYETCEKCGEKGELRKYLGWYLTLCDHHHLERKNKINGIQD
jgi:hypothetical protein